MTEARGVVVTRHLPVKLDQYRKNALAEEMAKQRGEELRIMEHMKRVTQSLKASILEAQNKLTIAAEAVVNGYEMLPVSCRQEVDLATNTARTIREDTGETIEERALEPKERGPRTNK